MKPMQDWITVKASIWRRLRAQLLIRALAKYTSSFISFPSSYLSSSASSSSFPPSFFSLSSSLSTPPALSPPPALPPRLLLPPLPSPSLFSLLFFTHPFSISSELPLRLLQTKTGRTM
ncbi:unnamed protein product [Dibothriocephalus latus]|uniref:Uncharacterized protein n=1 Tax=Dibothriocephalus latus TaxID=60516 RepID=A0A3P7Q1Q9_DIBLA|nr:unnamed protein product [Dibothriocephalus latus]